MLPSDPRPVRADARRNREAIVAAAGQLFAADGLGVPLDDIARHAGVGPGTVHRHFPSKQALYLAVATDQIDRLVAEARSLAAGPDDPTALSRLLASMIRTGTGALKSALVAAELDLRTAAPDVAAQLRRHVAVLLDRASAAGAVRADVDVDELMALVAGALAAIRHAGVESDAARSEHLAGIVFDGLRPHG